MSELHEGEPELDLDRPPYLKVLVINLVLSIGLSFFLPFSSLLEEHVENPWVSNLLSSLYMLGAGPLLATTFLIGLAGRDFAVRLLWMVLSTCGFLLVVGTALYIGEVIFVRQQMLSTQIMSAIIGAELYLGMAVAVYVGVLCLRLVTRWRMIGSGRYWRNPRFSIAGLLGLTFVCALLMVIGKACYREFAGLPLEPILVGPIMGAIVGTMVAITLPHIALFVMQNKRKHLFYSGIETILFAVLAVIIIFIFDAPQANVAEQIAMTFLAVFAMVVCSCVGVGFCLWLYRRAGWRLVKSRWLTDAERQTLRLPRIWETVDSAEQVHSQELNLVIGSSDG